MMKLRRILPSSAVLGLLIGVSSAFATTVVQPTFDRLVGTSDYIVRATVKSIESEWRDNAVRPGERYIGSKVTLEVHDVIKGNPPSPLVLDLVGGKVGKEELVMEGAPKFTVGQESILFVSGNGTNFFPVNSLMHGFFPIQYDARTGSDRVLRYDGHLLYSTSELDPTASAVAPTHSASDRAMTPDAFRDRIQQQQNDLNTREKLR